MRKYASEPSKISTSVPQIPTAEGAISSSPGPGTGSGRSTSSSRSSPWNSIARMIEQPSKELLTADHGGGTRQGIASPRDDDRRSARARARRRALPGGCRPRGTGRGTGAADSGRQGAGRPQPVARGGGPRDGAVVP